MATKGTVSGVIANMVTLVVDDTDSLINSLNALDGLLLTGGEIGRASC